MSTSPDPNSYFDDIGHNKGTAVEPGIDLPVAYIHNATDNGGDGGLLIKKEHMPATAIIDPAYFKLTKVRYKDRSMPSGYKEEEVYIANKYHLVLVAYDHDEKGRPNAWLQQNQDRGTEKWCLYVIAGIWQAWGDKPFRIKYQGASNAIRMSEHIRNFNKYVVGEATALKRQANPEALPACQHQFLLPVTHASEIVGADEANSSYACPVQEYLKEGLRITGPRRMGVSTLKRFSDDHEQLKRLYISKLEGGVAKVEQASEWITKYESVAKSVTTGDSDSTGSYGGDHFTEDEQKKATQPQIDKIVEIASSIGAEPSVEIQVLRGGNLLKGGKDDSSMFDLSKSGASILMNHLIESAKKARQAQKEKAEMDQTVSETGMVPANDAIPF